MHRWWKRLQERDTCAFRNRIRRQFTDSRMVCITGSNGKTTTTLLTYHQPSQGGPRRGPGRKRRQSPPYRWRSNPTKLRHRSPSFQLENMYQFKANIAVILNITPRPSRPLRPPDGELRSRKIQDSAESDKGRFLRSIGRTTQSSASKSDTCGARRCVSPRLQQREESAAWVDNGVVRFSAPGMYGKYHATRFPFLDFNNLYNSMAAGIFRLSASYKNDTIREALEDFEAVEHRLEYVATVDGCATSTTQRPPTSIHLVCPQSMTTPTVLSSAGEETKATTTPEIEASSGRRSKPSSAWVFTTKSCSISSPGK